jgi:hypothetical protein
MFNKVSDSLNSYLLFQNLNSDPKILAVLRLGPNDTLTLQQFLDRVRGLDQRVRGLEDQRAQGLDNQRVRGLEDQRAQGLDNQRVQSLDDQRAQGSNQQKFETNQKSHSR